MLGGRTLTIQAGTTVTFTSSDALMAGISPGKVEITVGSGGILRVNGTAASPAVFRAQTGSSVDTGGWAMRER